MKILNNENASQTIVDELHIYYNFIRLPMALNGKTPAEKPESQDYNRRNGKEF